MKTVCPRFLILLALCAVLHPVCAPAATFKLGITPAGNKVVITWPTNAANYVLQSTTNLAAPAWVTITNAPLVTSYTVTNPLPAQYFRLAYP